MSVFLQFIPNGHVTPISVKSVDKAICDYFKAPFHPERYFCEWVHSVGSLLAIDYRGVELRDHIRTKFGDSTEKMNTLLEISKFLEANYKIDSWSGPS